MKEELILKIFYGVMIAFSYFIAWAWGSERSKKFWKGLWEQDRKRSKDKVTRLMFRVAELADGLGGKCEVCKGFGVLGNDGQSDCWYCGGTGLTTLEGYKDQKIKLLEKAKLDAQRVLNAAENELKALTPNQ